MRRALWIVAFAALATACSSGGEVVGPTTTTQSTTTGQATGTTFDAAHDPAGLEPLLVDAVPAGYEQQPDDVGDTGTSDLAKAVRDDGSPDAEQALTDAGFVRGYQRLWGRSETSQSLVLFVYEFDADGGAGDYLARTVVAFDDPGAADPSFTSTTLPVPTIEGAVGIHVTGDSGDVAIVIYRTSVYVVMVQASGAAGSSIDADAITLAAAQRQRL